MRPPDPPHDPLAELRDRVRRTQAAAARLEEELGRVGEADGNGAPPPPPPGSGWEQPPPPRSEPRAGELEAALTILLELARSAVPREVQQQLSELVRELLLALKALIDWCLERLDPSSQAPPEVEDIPID